jgi:hypothetical protein
MQDFQSKWGGISRDYDHCCELAHRIYERALQLASQYGIPQRGCTSGIAKAVCAALNLKKSTFFDMRRHHLVKIGKMKDADEDEGFGAVAGENIEGAAEDEAEDEVPSEDEQETGDTNSNPDTKRSNRKRKAQLQLPWGHSDESETYTVTVRGAKLQQFREALREARRFYEWTSDERAIIEIVLRSARHLTGPYPAGVTREVSRVA